MKRTVDEIRRRALERLGKTALFTSIAKTRQMVLDATAAAMAAQAAGVVQDDATETIDIDPDSETRMNAAVEAVVEMEAETGAVRGRQRRPGNRGAAAAAVGGPGLQRVGNLPGGRPRVVRRLDNPNPPPPAPKRLGRRAEKRKLVAGNGPPPSPPAAAKRLRFSQGDKRKRVDNQPGGSRKKQHRRGRADDSSEDDDDDEN